MDPLAHLREKYRQMVAVLPPDLLGVIAQITKGLFENSTTELSRLLMESINDVFPPFYNSNPKELGQINRNAAVKDGCAYLKKHPTLYISADGGHHNLKDFSLEKTGSIKISLVLHAPFPRPEVANAWQFATYIEPVNLAQDESISDEMAVRELRVIKCGVSFILDPSYTCPREVCCSNCPLKSFNWAPYRQYTATEIVVFLDRPVIGYYLRAAKSRVLLREAKEFYNFFHNNGIPLISAHGDPRHIILINQVIDQISQGTEYMTPGSEIYDCLSKFLTDHPHIFDQIPQNIRVKYDFSSVQDLVTYISSVRDQRNLKLNFFDFALLNDQVFPFANGGFEFRTPTFVASNEWLKKEFPAINFDYFYVFYPFPQKYSWVRVEFINCAPVDAGRHYFIQSSLNYEYYPLILIAADHAAVVGQSLRKVIEDIITRDPNGFRMGRNFKQTSKLLKYGRIGRM